MAITIDGHGVSFLQKQGSDTKTGPSAKRLTPEQQLD
jgi:hypothetical protein